jgi:hypothetical protein
MEETLKIFFIEKRRKHELHREPKICTKSLEGKKPTRQKKKHTLA